MILDAFRLDQKIIAITGGAGFFARQFSLGLLEAGASLVLLDVNEKALDEVFELYEARYTGKTVVCETDITREDSLIAARDRALKRFQRYPDILINNAAIDPKVEKGGESFLRLENYSKKSWDFEISVGLTGAMLSSKVFGTKMAENGFGNIINVSSDLGIIAPDQRLYRNENLSESEQPVKPVTYSVIKHGLIGLTKYLSTYWADQGVRANAIAPGGIYNGQNDKFVTKIKRLIPLGRMANLGEYNAALLFLCSDASSYMNGSVLTMDGGRSAW